MLLECGRQAGSGVYNPLGEIPLDVHLAAPGHHGQEHFIGTKAAIAERSQLALVAGIVQLRPPEPPAAEHWPADTANSGTPEGHWRETPRPPSAPGQGLEVVP